MKTLTEQNSLLEKIVRDYGDLIKGAVHKATRGHPGGDDIISEVYFAVLLTLRKLGTGWTPPRSFVYSVVRNKVNDFLRLKYRDKGGIADMKKLLEEQASQKEEVVSRIHCLTASEFRVFRLLGLGMSNGEIAAGLNVSLSTIRSHLKKIHAKCGLKDRAKLTLIAHQVCRQEQAEEREAEMVSSTPAEPECGPKPARRSEPLLREADPPEPRYCR
jgi:RNA polymerase sigma factor (sigma-70 family)